MKEDRIVAIVQARLASVRLPGKVLKDIMGKPVLGHVVERLKGCRLLNEIVIATTEKENEGILQVAREYGVESFIGSEDDVLDRYYQAAKSFAAPVIVRITSDCPLIDPGVTDEVIRYYLVNKDRFDYVSNVSKRTFPRGLDTEVFSFRTLEKCWCEAEKTYEREHVTIYIREHPHIFKSGNVEAKGKLRNPRLRLTLDQGEDLDVIRAIYGKLYVPGKIFSTEEIIDLVTNQPSLIERNKSIRRKNIHVNEQLYPNKKRKK